MLQVVPLAALNSLTILSASALSLRSCESLLITPADDNADIIKFNMVSVLIIPPIPGIASFNPFATAAISLSPKVGSLTIPRIDGASSKPFSTAAAINTVFINPILDINPPNLVPPAFAKFSVKFSTIACTPSPPTFPVNFASIPNNFVSILFNALLAFSPKNFPALFLKNGTFPN